MAIENEIQQKKFDNEWQKALVNLHYTSNVYNDYLITKLRPYKINDQHYNILRILRGRYPEAACPGDIKAVLLNKRGDLTRLLDKLDKLGYVNRSTNAINRRMVDIIITDAGVTLLKKLKKEFNLIRKVRENISKDEAIQLNDLLDKLRE